MKNMEENVGQRIPWEIQVLTLDEEKRMNTSNVCGNLGSEFSKVDEKYQI